MIACPFWSVLDIFMSPFVKPVLFIGRSVDIERTPFIELIRQSIHNTTAQFDMRNGLLGYTKVIIIHFPMCIKSPGKKGRGTKCYFSISAYTDF